MTHDEQAVVEKTRRLLSACRQNRPALTYPTAVRDFVLFTLALREKEVYGVLLQDNQRRVLAWRELFEETINQVAVYPREVVKLAFHHNAAALILVHNHPSGVASASQAERDITQTLVSILRVVDVRVLDHLIVAGDTTVSMAELGQL